MADPMRRTEGETGTRRFVFVLLDQFTMLCFSSAVEALRIANRMSETAIRMDPGGRRRRESRGAARASASSSTAI
jgi:transcriptional regulator GlxA family with amidase domain